MPLILQPGDLERCKIEADLEHIAQKRAEALLASMRQRWQEYEPEVAAAFARAFKDHEND